MLRMNNQNGFWSYFWSAITGFFAMLTLQDVLFALGFLITGIFTWLTYRSNNRRNLTAEEEERKRTKILEAAYARGDVSNIPEAAKVVSDIEAVMQPQEK